MTLYEKLSRRKGGDDDDWRMAPPLRSPQTVRDYASIFVCGMIVFASISIGFVQAGIKVFFGLDVQFDASWNANLSSMASMALGALIQQKISAGPASNSQGNTSVTVPVDVTPAIPADPYAQTPNSPAGYCSCCGQPMPGATPSAAADANTPFANPARAPE